MIKINILTQGARMGPKAFLEIFQSGVDKINYN